MPHSEPGIEKRLMHSALILCWMLIAAGVLWALWQLTPLIRWVFQTLSPFLIALVVAYIFNPVVNLAQKRFRVGRVGGIALVALLIVLIVGLFFSFLIPVLFDQIQRGLLSMQSTLPETIDKWISRWDSDAAARFAEQVRGWVSNLDMDLQALFGNFSSAVPAATQEGANMVIWVAQSAMSIFGGIVGFFVAAVLVVVISFYYLLEFHCFPKAIRRALPARFEDRTMEVLSRMDVAVGGFLRGQIIAALIVGILTTIGLSAIGLWRYAVLIGFIAGAGNLIPYLGPVLGATPAILWALLSPEHATWPERFLFVSLVIGIFAIIQIIDGFVSQPYIVGRNSHLHPLVVMAALVVGARFGLTGMIIAVPVAAALRVLIKEFWWDAHVAAKAARQSEEAT